MLEEKIEIEFPFSREVKGFVRLYKENEEAGIVPLGDYFMEIAVTLFKPDKSSKIVHITYIPKTKAIYNCGNMTFMDLTKEERLTLLSRSDELVYQERNLVW